MTTRFILGPRDTKILTAVKVAFEFASLGLL